MTPEQQARAIELLKDLIDAIEKRREYDKVFVTIEARLLLDELEKQNEPMP